LWIQVQRRGEPVEVRRVDLSCTGTGRDTDTARVDGLDQIGGLLGNGVGDGLEMRGRHGGEDAGVDDAEVGSAVDAEVGGDDAAEASRHHGARAGIVVLGLQVGGEVRGEDGGGGMVRETGVGGLEDGEGGGVDEALVELHGGEHDGRVERVGEPAGVDERGDEGVGRGEGDSAAGQRVLQRDVEAAGVVVEDFVRGCGWVGEADEERGEVERVAGDEAGVIGGWEGGRGIVGIGQQGGSGVGDLG
jgi:hypothetical protein